MYNKGCEETVKWDLQVDWTVDVWITHARHETDFYFICDTLNQIDTIQSNTWGENSRNPSDDGRGSGGMTEEAVCCRRAYIHHKLLAHWSNFFAESGREHHNLLLVRCHSEYLLYISSHIWNQNSSAINSIIHLNVTYLLLQSSSRETKERGKAFTKPFDCKCVSCIIRFSPGWLFIHDGNIV